MSQRPKRWIGNGSIADVVVVWARDTEDGQVKGFLVEKGTPGYDAGSSRARGRSGPSGRPTSGSTTSAFRRRTGCPARSSFADTAAVLSGTRGACAWMALGHAVAGYDARADLRQGSASSSASRWPASRSSSSAGPDAGRRDGDAALLPAARPPREAGKVDPTLAGLAKLHNTTKARVVLAEARDLLGGNGILLENHVMRHMCDIEAVHTFEGTETIQTLIVGRDITGVSAFR